jgi:hypothetical protein
MRAEIKSILECLTERHEAPYPGEAEVVDPSELMSVPK